MTSEGPSEHVWAIVPARGGSIGVPRKNLRVIGGRPLIAHVITAALSVIEADHVVVVTDDDEIAIVARAAGAVAIREEVPTPGSETLDTKVLRTLRRLREFGALDDDIVLTIQPTSPLLTPTAIVRAVEALQQGPTASVLTVTDDRHLRWGLDIEGRHRPLYAARVNRQELPPEFRETGGVIGARLADIEHHGTRIIEPVALIELSPDESVDIDSFAELYAAAHLTSRLRIAIRTDAAPELGMGHVYRSLAVATELARHDIRVFTDASKPLGAEFFARQPYRHLTIKDESAFVDEVAAFEADLVILDVLDTDEAFIREIRSRNPRAKVLTFEDLGSGGAAADLHVAEFVPHSGPQDNRVLAGIENAVIAPAFDYISEPAPFHAEVREVLVLFGGTDPAGLADRALDSLERVGFSGRVTMVRGLGAKPLKSIDRSLDIEIFTDVQYMPGVIFRADFAFTSAGRTIIELASLGVPAICLAQNEREMTHTHATEANGVEMLGLGASVADTALDAAVRRLMSDVNHRRGLRASALKALQGRSNHRTIGRIFDRLGFDPFPNL